MGGSSLNTGKIIIYSGVALGNLSWILDIVYAIDNESNEKWKNNSLKKACVVFIFAQPLFMLFTYTLYIIQHNDIETASGKASKLFWGPVFTLLQHVKALSAFEGVHDWFARRVGYNESLVMLSLENTFKLQTVFELIFQSVPQMVIQSSNNRSDEKWSGIAVFTMIITVFMFVKNLSLVTIYAIRKFIDNKDEPPMRPRTSGSNFSRVEKEAFAQIQGYLIDPHDDGVDNDGNTTVHQLLKTEPDVLRIESRIRDLPHHLFMLNQYGQTPLDISIMEAVTAPIKTSPQKGLIAEKRRRNDLETGAAYKIENANSKTQFLISHMQKFTPECSLKFIKKPSRLDLKFEKSFSLCIKEKKTDLLELFPPYSVKTVYCSMH